MHQITTINRNDGTTGRRPRLRPVPAEFQIHVNIPVLYTSRTFCKCN